jgi:hypothetical protein
MEASRQNGKLTKGQIDKISSRQNDKLAKMSSIKMAK